MLLPLEFRTANGNCRVSAHQVVTTFERGRMYLQCQCISCKMAAVQQKTATFTMRIRPEVKAALLELARRESRTASDQLEALVLARCKALAIPVSVGGSEKGSA